MSKSKTLKATLPAVSKINLPSSFVDIAINNDTGNYRYEANIGSINKYLIDRGIDESNYDTMEVLLETTYASSLMIPPKNISLGKYSKISNKYNTSGEIDHPDFIKGIKFNLLIIDQNDKVRILCENIIPKTGVSLCDENTPESPIHIYFDDKLDANYKLVINEDHFPYVTLPKNTKYLGKDYFVLNKVNYLTFIEQFVGRIFQFIALHDAKYHSINSNGLEQRTEWMNDFWTMMKTTYPDLQKSFIEYEELYSSNSSDPMSLSEINDWAEELRINFSKSKSTNITQTLVKLIKE